MGSVSIGDLTVTSGRWQCSSAGLGRIPGRQDGHVHLPCLDTSTSLPPWAAASPANTIARHAAAIDGDGIYPMRRLAAFVLPASVPCMSRADATAIPAAPAPNGALSSRPPPISQAICHKAITTPSWAPEAPLCRAIGSPPPPRWSVQYR